MIYHGDCFEWLQHVDNDSVDMCYIDPPFFTQRDFGQFNDKWKSRGEYLTYIELRLIEIHRVLKDTGSIFLHCDWKASHRLRVMLDDVFGEKNFVNEIIWHYRRWTAPSKNFQRLHDTIFWYAKEIKKRKYNTIWVQSANDKKGRNESYKLDKDGKLVRWQTAKGKRYKIYKDDRGVHAGDVWEMPFIHPSSKERCGYKTQKPEVLLERIIKCSTNPGDTVLDPFMGSGTTAVVAMKLGREYITGDINKEAIKIANRRLIEEILK